MADRGHRRRLEVPNLQPHPNEGRPPYHQPAAPEDLRRSSNHPTHRPLLGLHGQEPPRQPKHESSQAGPSHSQVRLNQLEDPHHCGLHDHPTNPGPPPTTHQCGHLPTRHHLEATPNRPPLELPLTQKDDATNWATPSNDGPNRGEPEREQHQGQRHEAALVT